VNDDRESAQDGYEDKLDDVIHDLIQYFGSTAAPESAEAMEVANGFEEA
jgi:hypothetical protein